MTRMYNPPHLGEALREGVLPTLGFSLTDLAEQLGVMRVALIKRPISCVRPESAGKSRPQQRKTATSDLFNYNGNQPHKINTRLESGISICLVSYAFLRRLKLMPAKPIESSASEAGSGTAA